MPEEEVAVNRIDFETEKQAIQQVYSAFIKAYVAEDMTALQETLDITKSIEYGTSTGIVYGWNDVKIYIQANWEKEGADCQSDPNWELTDFYIRPENVSTPGQQRVRRSHVLLQPGNQRMLQRHRAFLPHKKVR